MRRPHLGPDEMAESIRWTHLPEHGRKELAMACFWDTLLSIFVFSLWVGYQMFKRTAFPGYELEFGPSWPVKWHEWLFDAATLGSTGIYLIGDLVRGVILTLNKVSATYYGYQAEQRRRRQEADNDT